MGFIIRVYNKIKKHYDNATGLENDLFEKEQILF
tara:strand:+ start:66575 stop:66676 length:102 start_codon:yes stop_codon:yes gene_type:complete